MPDQPGDQPLAIPIEPKSPSTAVSRRTFLRRALFGIGVTGVAGVGSVEWATRIEPGLLDVTAFGYRLPHLPPAFDGFKVVQISDLHFGGWMTPERFALVAQEVNRQNPDLIAVTGDFVVTGIWAYPDYKAEIRDAMRSLRAAAGVFATLGNHDHWASLPHIVDVINTAGNVALLRNQHRWIEKNGERLYIAGIDDYWERQQDLNGALFQIPPESAILLLGHEPDFWDEVRTDGRAGLMLAGHSHGGQVRLPFFGGPILPTYGQKYPIGLYRDGANALYVNRGVGMVAPYVRFGCPPEITVITLRL